MRRSGKGLRGGGELSRKTLLCLSLLSILQFLDWVTTWIADVHGIVEQNPLMHWVILSWGFAGLFVVKLLAVLVFFLLWRSLSVQGVSERVISCLFLLLSMVYVFIVSGNVVTIWG
ncbi:MAG: DUF5658 family protein [Methanosarcinales archaeon]